MMWSQNLGQGDKRDFPRWLLKYSYELHDYITSNVFIHKWRYLQLNSDYLTNGTLSVYFRCHIYMHMYM